MSKSYEVKITRQAFEHMEEITHYISNELCVPETANRLLQKLEEAVSGLSHMPDRVALINDEPRRTQGVRKIQGEELSHLFLDR